MDRPAAVELHDVVVRYGAHVVLPSLSLRVEQGEFLSLLGPSGCGKTTTLNAIAGFAEIASGSVVIQGKDVSLLPPRSRNLGMVFQRYALFPHMTVRANVAYGLRIRGVPATEARRRVAEALAVVRLEGFEQRHPHQLSGGQQQRVALCRALVVQPTVLLMDEPLSNLDANLRKEMQVEIKRIHAETGVTTVYVTHDQEEALLMSDRIAIMNEGRLEQLGRPDEVYTTPATGFVSKFMGDANLLPGVARRQGGEGWRVELADGVAVEVGATDGVADGAPVTLSIRQEALALHNGHLHHGAPHGQGQQDEASQALQGWPGTVSLVHFVGASYQYEVMADGVRLLVRAPAQRGRPPYRVGDQVRLSVAKDDVIVLPGPEAAAGHG